MDGRIVVAALVAVSAAACGGERASSPPADQSPAAASPVPAAPPPAPPTEAVAASEAAADRPFLMAIEDVFSIAGRATVVTGRIEAGRVRTGDEIEIVGIRDSLKARVAGVEMFRKIADSAQAGDNVGILLGGIKRDQVERGQVLARPGSIRACRRFDADLSALPGPDGRTRPFAGRRSAQLYFRTVDVPGTIEIPAGAGTSGGGVGARIALDSPIAMNPGLEFRVREEGRTIGTGTVTRCAG